MYLGWDRGSNCTRKSESTNAELVPQPASVGKIWVEGKGCGSHAKSDKMLERQVTKGLYNAGSRTNESVVAGSMGYV